MTMIDRTIHPNQACDFPIIPVNFISSSRSLYKWFYFFAVHSVFKHQYEIVKLVLYVFDRCKTLL